MSINSYNLISRVVIVILLLSLCSCTRTKDKNETVFNDYVFEENGIYYLQNCSRHSEFKWLESYEKYTGIDTGYYNNNKIWGISAVKNGLPDGHWQQFDSNGTKIVDLYFDNGKIVEN